ncbi:Neuropeptide-Like Protein [Caenorhabditis elegans]|uniref:Neuropeptide-Like Protein n=1 Tax=Caenorhabditis elegans TaxID=6239 RepID=Q9XWP3_CAEEL|nr:Neuropeptide-Like Protein [Caenorhabditis elegans]CAA21608.1 Neuropeptide-Like Protein [Caenorhabditis elegans]|eukprot:NP_507801.1 Neuropeptide-Like Protein [Caenorhabditis elegans]
MQSLIALLLLLVCFLHLAQCQWGGGWNNGGGYGNPYGGYGRGGGYGGGYGGGFGAQQAYNVQNAARIGTEVAEGVLVAEEVSEAIGK